MMNGPELEDDEQKLEDDEQTQDDEPSASEITIAGSMATFSRIWDTPEEDAAWKHLDDL